MRGPAKLTSLCQHLQLSQCIHLCARPLLESCRHCIASCSSSCLKPPGKAQELRLRECLPSLPFLKLQAPSCKRVHSRGTGLQSILQALQDLHAHHVCSACCSRS